MRTKILTWLLPSSAFLALFPLVLSPFYVYTVAAALNLGLLGMSLNLVLGYGGIYQFNHAVFYGFGAYSVALILTKTSLSAWAAFSIAPILTVIFSLVMGLICVRLSKLYFGMLQISLGSLLWAIVYRWNDFTNGDDGIHGIPLPEALSSVNGGYYFVLVVAVLYIFSMYIITASPFGTILKSIRDNPERSRAIGVNVKGHQLVALIIAGFYAGVNGVLFVILEGSVFPDLMFWTLSLELIIMCLLGGMFTFLGPLAGAAIMIYFRTIIAGYTEYWTMVQSVLFLGVIFFLPQGVIGFIEEKFKGIHRTN